MREELKALLERFAKAADEYTQADCWGAAAAGKRMSDAALAFAEAALADEDEDEERAGDWALIQMQADLLTRTVNALRGPPAPLHLHSHHDVPELAEALGRRLALAMDHLRWIATGNYGDYLSPERVARQGLAECEAVK